MIRHLLAACLAFPTLAAAGPSVFYNFDNLSHGGFNIDGQGDWYKAELASNADPAGIKGGKGSLEVRLHLKPGQDVRVAKYFQTGDLSMFKSMSFQVKAAKSGVRTQFFTMTDGWKWAQLKDIELPVGQWVRIDAPFSELPTQKSGKMNCLGLLFSSKDGYDASVYIDEITFVADKPYARDEARSKKSGFQATKSTVQVPVQVDGSVAHGQVKRGLIAFNTGDPIHGNTFISERLKEAGPGIMRFWSYGGYKTQMNFNPAEGKYDWAYHDREVKHLLSLGWEPMFCLGEPQKWNTHPKKYIPQDFKKWARMAGDMVRHYNVDLKLNIQYWEIWNEHDIGFWGGTEAEYLELLKVACKEMKKADPSIKIFAGAWANPGMVKKIGGAMLDKVPPKGLYDGISWHNYLVSSFTPEEKILSLSPQVEVPAHNAWKILRERGLESAFEVGMTEANINPSAETDWRQEGMLGAVYWASSLVHFIFQNSSLAVYFTGNGDDNYGTITDKAKPAYQSVLLASKYGKVVGKQWLKTSYDAKLANFEAVAMASEDEFTILAVNKDLKGTAYEATFDLAQLPELETLRVWGLDDSHLEVADLGTAKAKAGKLVHRFKPFSVTVLTGKFKAPRKLAAVQRAEPTSAALGLAVLGQYSFGGTPAQIALAYEPISLFADTNDEKTFHLAPPLKFDGSDAARVIGTKLEKPGDLGAVLRMMRGAKNLYLACVVTQGRGPMNNKDVSQLWNGDSIELSLSSKSDLAYKSRLKKSDWDYQICMAPTSKDGKATITCFNSDFKGMKVIAKATATGYRIAASIPLSNFEEQDWAAGKKVRFDVAIAKAGKDGNRESKLYWNATSDAWDSPDEWGLAEFK